MEHLNPIAAAIAARDKYQTSFPALLRQTVTQGHVNYCRDTGHARWTVDGIDQEICPRCGDLVNGRDARRAALARELEIAIDAWNSAPHSNTLARHLAETIVDLDL